MFWVYFVTKMDLLFHSVSDDLSKSFEMLPRPSGGSANVTFYHKELYAYRIYQRIIWCMMDHVVYKVIFSLMWKGTANMIRFLKEPEEGICFDNDIQIDKKKVKHLL